MNWKKPVAVLVIVHSDGWFTDYNKVSKFGEPQRLLFRDDDWVRREVRTALRLKKPVIPLLSNSVKILADSR